MNDSVINLECVTRWLNKFDGMASVENFGQ